MWRQATFVAATAILSVATVAMFAAVIVLLSVATAVMFAVAIAILSVATAATFAAVIALLSVATAAMFAAAMIVTEATAVPVVRALRQAQCLAVWVLRRAHRAVEALEAISADRISLNKLCNL